MVTFNQADTDKELILTLTEKQTLTGTFFFLIVFTHLVTKQVVTKIYSQGDEESQYPTRYNQFALNVATTFLNKPTGWWEYKAYEQPGGTNTNPALATTLLEVGKMYLKKTTAFEFDMQESATTFSISESNG